MSDPLTPRERERYDRQLQLQEFGPREQRRLSNATVTVAGVGGLGSVVALYLAAAGVGRIRLVDDDEVEVSNLNRQILYGDDDVGSSKVEVAARELARRNGDIEIEAVAETVTDESVDALIADADVVVDCFDNFESRYVLNRAAVDRDVILVHAAIHGTSGQATTVVPGVTPCLQCAIPESPDSDSHPVLGATAGLLGSIQVHEVITAILDDEPALAGELLLVMEGTAFERVPVERDSECPVCGDG